MLISGTLVNGSPLNLYKIIACTHARTPKDVTIYNIEKVNLRDWIKTSFQTSHLASRDGHIE